MRKELRDILASDLLERFVLGEVSEQEKMQVLALRQSSPEIKQALDELEETLERIALEEQMVQSPALRDKMLRQEYDTASPKTMRPFNGTWLAVAAY